jgi:hypothetical protein
MPIPVVQALQRFFYGLIERWDQWLLSLEGPGPRRALVTEQEAKEFKQLPPRAPMKSFEEDTFEYNLKGLPVQGTQSETVNVWIRDFATLKIDVFRLIKKEQTLPDATFLQKRYLRLLKQNHPDKGGRLNVVIDLNTAKERLNHLYASVQEQIMLFEAVFAEPFVDTPAKPRTSQSNASAYVLLYLVGAGIGTVLVLSRLRKD